MNEAAERIAEHRGDVEAATAAGYFVSQPETDSRRGSRESVSPPSFAQCEMEVRIAYENVEAAFAMGGPEAITAAVGAWWNARLELREAAIGEGR